MANEEHGEVIVDDAEDSNEEVVETTEEQAGDVDDTPAKAEKPKRTPEEELAYFEGRAARLRKKLGLETEERPTVEPKTPTTSNKSSDLDYGQIALLHANGIKGKEELALAREYMANGKSLLDVIENKHFLNDLSDLREARASQNAIPKGKSRSGQQGVTDVDIAIAKFKETGELPADFKTRSEVVKKAVEHEKSGNVFSGPSVIGPSVQQL